MAFSEYHTQQQYHLRSFPFYLWATFLRWWLFFADRSVAIGVAIPACAPLVVARMLRNNDGGARREQNTQSELLLLAGRAATEMAKGRLSMMDTFQHRLSIKALRDSRKRNREYRALVTANRVAEEARAEHLEAKMAAIRPRESALRAAPTALLQSGGSSSSRAPSSKKKNKKKNKQSDRSSDRSASRVSANLATGHGAPTEKRRSWADEMYRVQLVATRAEAIEERKREESREVAAAVREAVCVDVLKSIRAKLRLADEDREACKQELLEETDRQARFFVENENCIIALSSSFNDSADGAAAAVEKVLSIVLSAMAMEYHEQHDQAVRDAVECEAQCEKGVKHILETDQDETVAERDNDGVQDITFEEEQKTAEDIAIKEHTDQESKLCSLARARANELAAHNVALKTLIDDRRKADEVQQRVESAELEKLNGYIARGQALTTRRRDALQARDEAVKRVQGCVRQAVEAKMEYRRQRLSWHTRLIKAQNYYRATKNALETEMKRGKN